MIIDADKQEIKTVTFDETQKMGFHLKQLVEWMVVESTCNVENGDSELEPFQYYCQQMGIKTNEISKHPVEFGLTVNGHTVQHGNAMLWQIINNYDYISKRNSELENIDHTIQFEMVRETVEMANNLLELAEKLNDAMTGDDIKDAYVDEIKASKDNIQHFLKELK
ncbi:MAG: hypothetical protein RSC93_00230 [Erysipelotrichaceae bacterium]